MSLIGDQINISSSLTDLNGTGVTVDGNVETSIVTTFSSGEPAVQVDLDVSDDSFSLSFLNFVSTVGLSPLTLTLSDLDWVGMPDAFITGVTSSVSSTTAAGIMLDIPLTTSFTDDSVTISHPLVLVLPSFFSPGDVVTLNFDITTECFLPGTRILTDRGEVNVEDLTIGDLVQTADGFQPIKWIGKQTVDPNRVKSALRSHPICVKAGALGDNLPQRDLYLSPDHALLVEGLLINAGALVNGTSIIKTEPTEIFTYYHIELDIHALMVVEGTYAESYLPQKEDRHCYDNSDEFDALYPGQCTMILWPLDYPRVSSYTTVPRYIRKHLNAIADDLLKAEQTTEKVLQLA